MRLGGHVEFVARIGSVPELVNEMCGHKLVRFIIAVVDRHIDSNRYSQQTRWYTVNALGDTAEMLLESGLRICDKICIDGRLVIDEDHDTHGNSNHRYEIIAESISVAKDSCARSFEVA